MFPFIKDVVYFSADWAFEAREDESMPLIMVYGNDSSHADENRENSTFEDMSLEGFRVAIDYIIVIYEFGASRPSVEEEYLAVLDYVCDSALPLQSRFKSRVPTGMETPAALKNKGIEEPFWMRDPLFRTFYQMGSSTSNDDEDADAVDFEKLLGKAESSAAAEAVVCEGLVQKLCSALMIEAEAVDTAKPLHLYGVDSLVAVELRSWFAKEMGAGVAVFDFMWSGSN